MKTNYIIRNTADIKEIEKVPLKDRVKEKSTYELLEKGAAINPDGPAISFMMTGESYKDTIQITYQHFIKRIRQTANMLHELGVGPNDVVTYLLPNLPQTHFVLWGSEAVGIANPVNFLLEASSIKDICIAAKTKVIVALGELPGTDIWKKVESIRDDIPSLTHVIRVMGPSDKENSILGFEEVIDSYEGERLVFERDFDPEDIASIYHTGGTTGKPKLAPRTHGNEINVTMALNLGIGLQPGGTVMVGLPLFHANGTILTGLLPFSAGGHVVLLAPAGFREATVIPNFYKMAEYYKPVYFSCVPTILSALLEVPVDDSDISSLKFVACGAAPLSVELFNRFETYCGIKIIEGYGLTETTVACSFNPIDGERKVGSIGITLPYQEMKTVIVDIDGNYVRDCKTDEIGVVCIKGSCVFKGYLEEHHNEKIWLQDGWLNSGDIGRQDADGYFWLAGREKELIIRGGHNIDPATIEEPIYKMDGVIMAAAVGRPDAHAGEVPVVYVEVAESSDITKEDIMNWSKDNIGERAAIPKDVIITDQIPLTAVGKIFKPALKWDITQRIYTEELKALGGLATIEQISVGEDKLHGTNATITLKAGENVTPEELEKSVSKILSLYSVHYDLIVK